jgi:VanZ family protein
MKKSIRWGLLIVWMVIIFLFSQQPGDVSSEQSRLVVYIFNLAGINLDSALGNLSTFIVRKAAHFTEYLILGLLTYNALRENVKFNKSLILAVIIVFLYASSDEFHQSFIPGRGPAFRDVLIDTSGGLTGIMGVYICHHRKSLIKSKK